MRARFWWTREAASELGIQVSLESPDQPLEVQADPVLLRMVVGNLTSNALESLSACDAGGKLEVLLWRSPGLASLRVSDNGPGVPADLAGRLFEPFVTGKPSGVGLGLALSRRDCPRAWRRAGIGAPEHRRFVFCSPFPWSQVHESNGPRSG